MGRKQRKYFINHVLIKGKPIKTKHQQADQLKFTISKFIIQILEMCPKFIRSYVSIIKFECISHLSLLYDFHS